MHIICVHNAGQWCIKDVADNRSVRKATKYAAAGRSANKRHVLLTISPCNIGFLRVLNKLLAIKMCCYNIYA